MTDASLRAGAVVVAFALDRLFGEPPARLHPVVWMGKALGATGAPWPRLPPSVSFSAAPSPGSSVAAWCSPSRPSRWRRWQTSQLPPWTLLAQVLLLGILLKPLLAWRMLRDEVAAVERALATGLEQGRHRLSRLVSRDTRRLSAGQVRESALESLAENLNDSLVAPLFWFSLGGLPAAALYRFANTADAMWGYRDRWEWAGKWAARADDLLSYLPARLTALLLALSGWRSPQRAQGGGARDSIAERRLAHGNAGARLGCAAAQARCLRVECRGPGAERHAYRARDRNLQPSGVA